MKYYFILAMTAVFIAFSVPTQIDKTSPDGIKETKKINTIQPITTALETKPTQTPIETEKPSNTPQIAPQGGCIDWVRAAGITDIDNAMELIRRESNCNPNAINSSSGACGIAQELPCGKSGCSLGDGACQVRWMNQYVIGRYGSFASAISWHNSHNWY